MIVQYTILHLNCRNPGIAYVGGGGGGEGGGVLCKNRCKEELAVMVVHPLPTHCMKMNIDTSNNQWLHVHVHVLYMYIKWWIMI